MTAHEHGCTHEHHQHEPSPVKVDTHEGAVIGSYRFETTGTEEEISTAVEHFISYVGEKVSDSCGIIGHIKAFAEYRGGGFQVSMTDDETMKRAIPYTRAKIEGVAIVFNITPEELENILIESLEKYIKG